MFTAVHRFSLWITSEEQTGPSTANVIALDCGRTCGMFLGKTQDGKLFEKLDDPAMYCPLCDEKIKEAWSDVRFEICSFLRGCREILTSKSGRKLDKFYPVPCNFHIA